MHIETLNVAGINPAMHAMRNPMNSWQKNDTIIRIMPTEPGNAQVVEKVGPNDKELSIRLQKAGPEHCKHLRMVLVWADIEMPRYWWQEFDTYRAGVEKVSCSTMHKLTSRPLEMNDFDVDGGSNASFGLLEETIPKLNEMMDQYLMEKDADEKKRIWRGIIQTLPQSYIQRRTVMMSYAALRNIVRQREGHKLKEWKIFIDWVHTLPESWMIFE